MVKKSNKKYSYKSFSEWLNNRKYRKRLGVVLLLLFIMLGSFFPYWLFQKAENTIDVELNWGNSAIYGVDLPVVDWEVELWTYGTNGYDGVYISTLITDVDGLASFYVDTFGENLYSLKIWEFGTYKMFKLDDIDEDGFYDLETVNIGVMLIKSEVRWDRPDQALITETIFNLLEYNGTDWVFVATVETNGLGEFNFWMIGNSQYKIQGATSILPLFEQFTYDDRNYIDTIFIKSIAMLISSILIIVMIIWKWKSQIINKSIKKFTKNKTIRRYGDTDDYRKEKILQI